MNRDRLRKMPMNDSLFLKITGCYRVTIWTGEIFLGDRKNMNLKKQRVDRYSRPQYDIGKIRKIRKT